MGSSMAENHPVGFQWVVEARERGAKVIHVDPRFTRTSAMADVWVGLGTTAPGLIGTMSFQLAIPRQVALPQSLPPLHQPGRILQDSAQAVQSNCSER